MRLLAIFITICGLLTGFALEAQAEKRVALILGNGAYGGEIGALKNPVADAKLIADTLKKLGFETQLVLDADQKTMKRAIKDFGARLAKVGKDGIGLFYYAGHGIQVDGENFLIPVGAEIEAEKDVSIEAVSANDVLSQMEFARNGVNLIFLDACRNNPLSRSFRSSSRGLARVDAPRGSFVGYSTAPGDVAADGDGANSPYALALVSELGKPGVSVDNAHRNVRKRVLDSTGEKQTPWDSSSLIGEVILNKTGAAIAAAPAAESEPTQTDSIDSGSVDRSPGKTFRDCPDCPEMVGIPAGEFEMGSPKNEDGRFKTEGPVHDVTIGKPFAISRTEVTVAEYRAFIEATGRTDPAECWAYQDDTDKWIREPGKNWADPGFAQEDNSPVVCTSWDDAKDYAAWLAETTGAAYRLPSEAEWEYAARAGTDTVRHYGDDADEQCTYANGADITYHEAIPKDPSYNRDCTDGYVRTSPVATFKPNQFGLYDMLGNAWEWTQDCAKDSYSGAPDDGSAVGGGCGKVIIRGGSWGRNPDFLRSATRGRIDPEVRGVTGGIRVVREL